MFPSLLILHSILRWFILVSIVLSLFYAYRGWLKNKPFTKFDNYLRIATVSFVHIQLIIGFWLYLISPIVDYFLTNFNEALHMTQARFFGMEHITMMVLAVTAITIGSSIARRTKDSTKKFKVIAIWYTIAFIFIFTSIPWPFSPFTTRPYIRFF